MASFDFKKRASSADIRAAGGFASLKSTCGFVTTTDEFDKFERELTSMKLRGVRWSESQKSYVPATIYPVSANFVVSAPGRTPVIMDSLEFCTVAPKLLALQ